MYVLRNKQIELNWI